ncbi:expressed unknown protein [Seminavis robusta]|uniref:Uncharacterized protein n=1 Tax=Seminavis robusta TaxID=568900 RepID=A0A9N8HT52_9STRA|nr:expressed unknown protein [Seminavis robusta]|eukprot:Sro1823_g299870.1 n/a (515) ;mRNA; f:2865-4409
MTLLICGGPLPELLNELVNGKPFAWYRPSDPIKQLLVQRVLFVCWRNPHLACLDHKLPGRRYPPRGINVEGNVLKIFLQRPVFVSVGALKMLIRICHSVLGELLDQDTMQLACRHAPAEVLAQLQHLIPTNDELMYSNALGRLGDTEAKLLIKRCSTTIPPRVTIQALLGRNHDIVQFALDTYPSTATEIILNLRHGALSDTESIGLLMSRTQRLQLFYPSSDPEFSLLLLHHLKANTSLVTLDQISILNHNGTTIEELLQAFKEAMQTNQKLQTLRMHLATPLGHLDYNTVPMWIHAIRESCFGDESTLGREVEFCSGEWVRTEYTAVKSPSGHMEESLHLAPDQIEEEAFKAFCIREIPTYSRLVSLTLSGNRSNNSVAEWTRLVVDMIRSDINVPVLCVKQQRVGVLPILHALKANSNLLSFEFGPWSETDDQHAEEGEPREEWAASSSTAVEEENPLAALWHGATMERIQYRRSKKSSVVPFLEAPLQWTSLGVLYGVMRETSGVWSTRK